MQQQPQTRYSAFKPLPTYKERQWPNCELTKAPLWCSVDLRDGNQALINPMTVEQKIEFFNLLVRIGFTEIEIGFPAASPTEFAFVRRLIEEDMIPSHVTIQVLTQAREDLIDRTIEALKGAKKVIIHMYNSTSPAQRELVFGLDKDGIIKIAQKGIAYIKENIFLLENTNVTLEYSPESFSATEPQFALDICESVIAIWQPTVSNPMIINLPETVEVTMPNVYADQVEWFCTHVSDRDSLIISVHTHNDRGTGVAATELALLAGADRVEGTLFGNGERTGNLDIVIVALNLYMHGIHPELDFSDINLVKSVYEKCTGMIVPPRHPYSGELVFTAFSGSHQDAIKKGFAAQNNTRFWDVPYLTIDPRDIGREYHGEVIRVNGQSGKAGVAYLLESSCNIELPKELQREFGPIANDEIDRLGREVNAQDVINIFRKEYVERDTPFSLIHFKDTKNGFVTCSASICVRGENKSIEGKGNGPIAAFVNALRMFGIVPYFDVVYFSEQSMSVGVEATAICYIQIESNGKKKFGVGTDTNSELAPIKAVISALNRLFVDK